MTSANKRTLERLNEHPEKFMDVLKRLGGLRVSILLPISTKPPESDQNIVRLKELYRRGIDLLTENGLNPEGAERFLQPVEALLEDPKSLLRPAETLVFFIDEDSASLVEIPYRIDSQVAVGNRFVLKPLLPLIQHDSTFTVACLNRGQVTVYKGTRLGIREVKVPNMPTTLQDVVKFDDPEKSLQHHTAKSGAAKGRSGSSPVPAMHGQGLPSDLEKSQNERFFREVANAIRKYLANERSPLVLFGVDENIGLFKSATDWGDQEVLSVHHDPKDWSKADILRHATDLLMPYWERKISEKVERLEEACGKDTAIIDTAKCVLAAAHGRVEMACVASDRTEPGVCQPEKMQVEFVEADAAGCALDLLDTIAFETIQHGGEAFALPADKIPGPGNSAATVRFEVK
jgi:hypothetical protein